MRLKNYIYFSLFVLMGCSGSSGGGETPEPPPPPPAPTVAVLKTPAQNSECLDGENVEFSWNASQNTDSYTIVVKNLLTTAQISQTTTSTSVTIKLDVGQPYSWFITSSSSVSSQTASTTKWKFYLKGEPTINYEFDTMDPNVSKRLEVMKRLDEVEQIQYLKYLRNQMRYEDNPKETEKLFSTFRQYSEKLRQKTKIPNQLFE